MQSTEQSMMAVASCSNPDRFFAESMIPHHKVRVSPCLLIEGLKALDVDMIHYTEVMHAMKRCSDSAQRAKPERHRQACSA